MAIDYNGILEAVVTALKSDSTLTDFLALRTIGAVESKANSILYNEPRTSPLFPSVYVRDVGPTGGPAHEHPMYAPVMHVEIAVAALPYLRRPIQARIDEFLEEAYYQNGMDSATWKIRDIDTGGGWMSVPLRSESKEDQWGDIELAIKTFVVKAATKV